MKNTYKNINPSCLLIWDISTILAIWLLSSSLFIFWKNFYSGIEGQIFRRKALGLFFFFFKQRRRPLFPLKAYSAALGTYRARRKSVSPGCLKERFYSWSWWWHHLFSSTVAVPEFLHSFGYCQGRQAGWESALALAKSPGNVPCPSHGT